MMMIKGDAVVIAHHVQVMLHIRQDTPASLHGTKILSSTFPHDTVIVQAFF
jgi:hypothetical protein